MDENLLWLPSVVGERAHVPVLRKGRLVARCSRRVELWEQPGDGPRLPLCGTCLLIEAGCWGTARRPEH